MAITFADWSIWNRLKANGLIPVNPCCNEDPVILEIGEANHYGDVPVQQILEARIAAGLRNDFNQRDSFAVAKAFYEVVIGTKETFAIDMHGTAAAHKLDLNKPQTGLRHDHDIIINTGTTEHIFDQRQVFETIHDACRPGGLMFHGVPWRGWLDHGFYCYQPTFFFDLARANSYDIIVCAGFQLGTTWLTYFASMDEIHAMEKAKQLPAELMLYVVLRKTNTEPFKIPMQGIYDDARGVDEKLRADWKSLRSG